MSDSSNNTDFILKNSNTSDTAKIIALLNQQIKLLNQQTKILKSINVSAAFFVILTLIALFFGGCSELLFY